MLHHEFSSAIQICALVALPDTLEVDAVLPSPGILTTQATDPDTESLLASFYEPHNKQLRETLKAHSLLFDSQPDQELTSETIADRKIVEKSVPDLPAYPPSTKGIQRWCKWST